MKFDRWCIHLLHQSKNKTYDESYQFSILSLRYSNSFSYDRLLKLPFFEKSFVKLSTFDRFKRIINRNRRLSGNDIIDFIDFCCPNETILKRISLQFYLEHFLLNKIDLKSNNFRLNVLNEFENSCLLNDQCSQFVHSLIRRMSLLQNLMSSTGDFLVDSISFPLIKQLHVYLHPITSDISDILPSVMPNLTTLSFYLQSGFSSSLCLLVLFLFTQLPSLHLIFIYDS